jgi:hypothetical protein
MNSNDGDSAWGGLAKRNPPTPRTTTADYAFGSIRPTAWSRAAAEKRADDISGEPAAEGPSLAAGREPRRYLPDLAQGSRFAQGAGTARFAGEATRWAGKEGEAIKKGPSRRLRPSCLVRCYARSEDAVADVDGARTVGGEDRLVAASAGIERRPKVAMAPVTMTISTMTMAEMHAMAAMPVTAVPMTAAGGRRSNRSRGQRESRDGSEGNLAKHLCSPFQA